MIRFVVAAMLLLLPPLGVRPATAYTQTIYWSSSGIAGGTVSNISWPGGGGTFAMADTALGVSYAGTMYQFTCTLSDGSPCWNQRWSFSNLPSFLTSGTLAQGGYVQLVSAPPDGSGTFTATAGSFSKSVPWSVSSTVPITSFFPSTIFISDSAGNGSNYWLTCTFADTSPCYTVPTLSSACVGSNTTNCLPTFLSPGVPYGGWGVHTNQNPPIPDGSGTFTLTVGSFSQVINWTVGATSPILDLWWVEAPNTMILATNLAQGSERLLSCQLVDATPCRYKTWSVSNAPSFLTASTQDQGLVLTTNQAPPLPSSSGTMTVTVAGFSKNVPWVSQAISPAAFDWPDAPGTLFIHPSAANGTIYQFTCRMSDRSMCDKTPAGVSWSFSGLPSFLTSGTNSNGGYLQVTQPVPTNGSGSFTVTAN